MRYLLNSILVLLIAFGLNVGVASTDPSDSDTAEWVSMIQLIATPERYEGKVVILTGHLRFGFEESVLYFHNEDAEVMNTQNALWLPLGDENHTGKYSDLDKETVCVKGRFKSGRQGHAGGFSRGIDEIESIELAPTRAYFNRIRRSTIHLDSVKDEPK